MRENLATDNGSHPELGRWIAYRAGGLAPADEETLQDHLVDCRSCTALVLDLESFADPAGSGLPGAPPPVSDFEQAAVWRTLRPQLGRRRPARRRWTVPATVAASLLAALLGGGLWLQQRELSGLRAHVAALSRPQANAPIYDLFPRAVVRGEAGSGPGATLEIPAAALAFTLILNRVESGELGTCRAEIVDPPNRRLAIVDGLEMDAAGVFTFSLPRGTLAAGDYVVRLWGAEGEAETPVEEYPLRIVYR